MDKDKWNSMPNQERRKYVDDESDVTREWDYLSPKIKYSLKTIEALVYKNLCKLYAYKE